MMAPPDVNPHIKAQGKDVHWYKADHDNVSEPARQLLESYSGLSPDQVIQHISQIRDRAWAIFPYPCIGQFRFLDLSISMSPLYPNILSLLIESKQTLLDLGCCFAQDIRKPVADGAPSENIYGAELHKDFLDLGYDLFRDRSTLKAKFVLGDVFDSSAGSEFSELDGRLDIIYAGSFFHLFNWEDQVRLRERVVNLLKPVKGSVCLGRQRGNIHPGEYEHRTNETGTMFRHNEESWKRMWKLVGQRTKTSWVVDVRLKSAEDFGLRRGRQDELDNVLASGDRRLRFEVARV